MSTDDFTGGKTATESLVLRFASLMQKQGNPEAAREVVEGWRELIANYEQEIKTMASVFDQTMAEARANAIKLPAVFQVGVFDFDDPTDDPVNDKRTVCISIGSLQKILDHRLAVEKQADPAAIPTQCILREKILLAMHRDELANLAELAESES